MGHTDRIPYYASDNEVQGYLEALSTISSDYGPALSVQMNGQAFCSASSTLTKIDFLQDFGNLPLIVADGNGLALSASTSPKVSVSEVRAGTKEDEPCSNRGICDEEIGVCSCMDYMTTSDGYGNEGQRGDCGYASQQLVDCPNENSPCNMKGAACNVMSCPGKEPNGPAC